MPELVAACSRAEGVWKAFCDERKDDTRNLRKLKASAREQRKKMALVYSSACEKANINCESRPYGDRRSHAELVEDLADLTIWGKLIREYVGQVDNGIAELAATEATLGVLTKEIARIAVARKSGAPAKTNRNALAKELKYIVDTIREKGKKIHSNNRDLAAGYASNCYRAHNKRTLRVKEGRKKRQATAKSGQASQGRPQTEPSNKPQAGS